MDLLDFLITYGGNLLRLFGVIAALMVIIFVHELGHYLVGRWCGVGVRVFSIGFGAQIWGRRDKHGTLWRVAAIPFGGYVKFVGDEDALSSPQSTKKILPDDALERFPKSVKRFSDKKRGETQELEHLASPSETKKALACAAAWKRACVAFAGPLFNAIYTLIVLSAIFFAFGSLRLVPIIGSVITGSPADLAGFQVGDRFLTMQGAQVDNFRDIALYISSHEGDAIAFTVERGGQEVALQVIPQLDETDDGFGNMIRVGRIGITTSNDEGAWQKIEFGPLASLQEGGRQSLQIVKMTGNFIARIFQGRADRCQLSGPVRSGQIAWRVMDFGFVAFLQLTAFFSLSIGLFNLLPMPPLDGGRLVFDLIETITRRPVPQATQAMFFKIGTIFVFGLIIFAVINNMIPC